MTGVKRLAALVLLVVLAVGAWLLLRPSPAADILISNARVELQDDGAIVTLGIANAGGPDMLIAAGSPEAEGRIVSSEGKTRLPIPAGSNPVLSDDGAYVALPGLTGLATGQLIPITLNFERAGTVTTQARVSPPDPHAKHKAHMGHVMLPDDQPAPEISMTVTPDGSGWAVHVETHNFTLNEDMADGPHVPGVGHAHLYLDGLKLQRLFRRDAHVGALPPGRYTLRVTLNANDHRVYMQDGVPISATAVIEVP